MASYVLVSWTAAEEVIDRDSWVTFYECEYTNDKDIIDNINNSRMMFRNKWIYLYTGPDFIPSKEETHMYDRLFNPWTLPQYIRLIKKGTENTNEDDTTFIKMWENEIKTQNAMMGDF